MSRASDALGTASGTGGTTLNRVLARLAARQLLGRRRTLLAGAVMLLPILLAVLYVLIDESPDPKLDAAAFAVFLNDRLMLGLLVPILALVVGTAALGAELEDGTAVFLLSKPVGRQRILAVKTAMAVAVCVALVTPASLASTWLVVGSPSSDGMMLGLGLTVLVAAVVYSVVFVALSAATHRAIMFGLAYVFLWEALITNVFPGMSWVSISDYAYGWGNAFIDSSAPIAGAEVALDDDPNPYNSSFGLVTAVVGTLVATAVAAWFGAARLARFQIGERK